MKFGVRKNLESNKYYVYCVVDGDDFDIWSFNDFLTAVKVKELIEKDSLKEKAYTDKPPECWANYEEKE